MTGAIAAVGAVVQSFTAPAAATAPTAATGAAGVAGQAGGGFADVLTNAMNGLNGVQSQADKLAVQAASGDLTNLQDYMVAAEKANVSTQLTVAVRNNAVQAFNQIIGMQA